jgi:hypothetical protein
MRARNLSVRLRFAPFGCVPDRRGDYAFVASSAFVTATADKLLVACQPELTRVATPERSRTSTRGLCDRQSAAQDLRPSPQRVAEDHDDRHHHDHS